MPDQHTPGPWEVIHNVYGHSRLAIMQPTGVLITEVVDWPDNDIADANAQLIAAAPDLLAICEELYRIIPGIGGADDIAHEWLKLKDAIAKARGEL